MSRHRFTTFAWGVFAYSLLVILWGYFLRISESGDGCGTDWPLCRGGVVPEGAELSTWVELTHRVTSGGVLLLVIAMAVLAFRSYPRGHGVRTAAAAALLFTVGESLFGAVLVVFGWVAADVSTGRIVIRPLHVTNTFFLMAALALTPFRAMRAAGGGGIGVPGAPPLRELRRSPAFRLLAPGLLGVLALGWTGAWTGLATTAFPVASVGEGAGQYLDAEHLLIYLRLAHPVLAVAVVLLLLRIARRLRERHREPVVRRLAAGIGALAVVQLAWGVATVLLVNPAWSRLVHLLLADLLWITVVLAADAAVSVGRAASPPAAAGAGAPSPTASPPSGHPAPSPSALDEGGVPLESTHEGGE